MNCSFLALAPPGLNFSIWPPPQKPSIFLILLFIKLLIFGLGASGARFLNLATLRNYDFVGLRGRQTIKQILIWYCFLQWFIAIHPVSHIAPKSDLHCFFHISVAGRMSSNGPGNHSDRAFHCFVSAFLHLATLPEPSKRYCNRLPEKDIVTGRWGYCAPRQQNASVCKTTVLPTFQTHMHTSAVECVRV